MSRFYFNVVLLSLCGVCDFGSVWGGLSVNTLGWVCELAWIMMPSLRRLQIWGQTRKMQGFCRKRDNFLATAGPRRGLWGKFGPWCRKVGRPQSDLPSSDLRTPTCISFSYSHSPFSIFTYITVYDIPLFPLLIFKHLLFDILICSLLLFSYPASSPQS